MQRILAVVIIVSFATGFFLELAEIAESVSDKALAFADSINMAMECAFNGVDLEECSPQLLNHSFDDEINRTQLVLKDMINQSQQNQTSLEEIEQLLQDANVSTIIIVT